jgi:hypothetical protein
VKSFVFILCTFPMMLFGTNISTTDFASLDCLESVYTFKYRGHSYIVWKGFNRGSMLHDPDCECLKEDKEVKDGM